MPADQAPQRLIGGLTVRVYYRHRRAEGSVRCSDWLGGATSAVIMIPPRGPPTLRTQQALR
jgi:hypothetical protein